MSSTAALAPGTPPATIIVDERSSRLSFLDDGPRVVERARGSAHRRMPTTRPVWPPTTRHARAAA
jgi:hypothetical protein